MDDLISEVRGLGAKLDSLLERLAAALVENVPAAGSKRSASPDKGSEKKARKEVVEGPEEGRPDYEDDDDDDSGEEGEIRE